MVSMDVRHLKTQSSEGADNGAALQRPLPAVIDHPLSSSTGASLWRDSVQFATLGIFLILFVAALDLARPVLLPVTAAFVVTMMLGPLSTRADRHGIPKAVTAILLWLLVAGVFYGLIMLLSAPVVDWIGKAPQIGRSIQDKLLVLEQPLSALRSLRNALLPADAGKGIGFDVMSIVQPALSIVTPAIGQVIIFLGTLFFMLLGRSRLRHELVAAFRNRDARLRTLKILNDIEANLTGYLSVVAVINFSMGVIGGVVAWAVGLPDPLAWGVLAFVLNFIPYVGSLLMELAMFMVGLVSFPSLTHAIIAPLVYLVCATLEGEIVTPSAVGRKFTLNPLLVFLSLVFWAWLWGPVGAFLAAPLLIIGLAAFVHLFPKQEPELPD
ncbi:MAG TPA: AI-2E family transporter [Pseudolabrys sp.]|jgi:predicted PurR-regulated permease PerM|nr:AI-2E family transporter [Pseudolabrys sp.]